MALRFIFVIVMVNMILSSSADTLEEKAEAYMVKLDEFMLPIESVYRNIMWNYTIDMTEQNENELVDTTGARGEVRREFWKEMKNIEWNHLQKKAWKHFKKNSNIGTDVLPLKRNLIYLRILFNFTRNYFDSGFNVDSLKHDILSNSNDSKALEDIWLDWHNKVGGRNRVHYSTYVKIMQEASVEHGDLGVDKHWERTLNYDESILQSQWDAIIPFYRELHAYVRNKLKEKYTDKIEPNGPIPAHLFGSLEGDSWEEIYSFTKPFPNSQANITKTIKQKEFTIDSMFREADKFFLSLDMKGFHDNFWKNSIFVKPKNNLIDCYPQAWNFLTNHDYRVKLCAEENEKYMGIAFELATKIQYMMQFEKHEYTFRDEAHPGFAKAVGGAVRLSMTSPRHLNRMGLKSKETEEYEETINRLYKLALEIIPQMPYFLTLDAARFNVYHFNDVNNLQCNYWTLREKHQGVIPPTLRFPKNFDIGTDYHFVKGEDTTRYFKAFIWQFEIYQFLCEMSEEYVQGGSKLLSHCDLNDSKEVGYLLGKLLSYGDSKIWPLVLNRMIGFRGDSPGALLEYFRPLHEWLKGQNKKKTNFVGWKTGQKEICKKPVLHSGEEDWIKPVPFRNNPPVRPRSPNRKTATTTAPNTTSTSITKKIRRNRLYRKGYVSQSPVTNRGIFEMYWS